jgi:ribonuclease BN (tRNA processing enzyme)
MADLGLTIHFLGTGSASPNANRDNSSLLIVVGGRAVMVDVSGYPGHKLPKLGIGFDRLTDLVLTHGHIDHIYAFPSLVSSLISVVGFQSMHLKVHGLHQVLDVARTLLMPFAGSGGTITMNGLSFIPLYDDNGLEPLDIQLDDWRLSSFPVNHGDVSAIGLALDHSSGTRIVYSGDARADSFVASQITASTICLIHDCASGMEVTPRTVGHASAVELRAMLTTSPQPEYVYITHLSARQDHVLPDMLALLQQDYRGMVCAAYDGLTLRF